MRELSQEGKGGFQPIFFITHFGLSVFKKEKSTMPIDREGLPIMPKERGKGKEEEEEKKKRFIQNILTKTPCNGLVFQSVPDSFHKRLCICILHLRVPRDKREQPPNK